MDTNKSDTVTIRIGKPNRDERRLIRSLTPKERTQVLVKSAQKRIAKEGENIMSLVQFKTQINWEKDEVLLSIEDGKDEPAQSLYSVEEALERELFTVEGLAEDYPQEWQAYLIKHPLFTEQDVEVLDVCVSSYGTGGERNDAVLAWNRWNLRDVRLFDGQQYQAIRKHIEGDLDSGKCYVTFSKVV